MPAKTLMIQGTGSGVGKSILTAAFCRHYYLQGLKVAPFKAQNMALNSFVTEDGGEMGRAQVYQAEACGIKPHVSMNPVLLKPSGDNCSQVIVMGKAVEHRNAKDYFAGRKRYTNEVRSAFEQLRNRYDLIVLEGAGSPAEINLREMDFVNMAMAKMADAPVILVGDIDRGGVFAWMKGTYDLLLPEEQKRVVGFLINKFRGDQDLLEPGIQMFEEMVNKPVLGVLPYIRDFVVDEEDALPTLHFPAEVHDKTVLTIVVILLPRISNFTDFDPLAHDPNINLRYVSHPGQLDDPDLIILPGSKNTPVDLQTLNDSGMADKILQCHRNGSLLLGVCAGFQMLGKKVLDPHHVESPQEETRALGLFEMETTLLKEKSTCQLTAQTQRGPVFEERISATGYEIHMGETRTRTHYPELFQSAPDSKTHPLGLTNDSGTVIGTYLHGFLDALPVRSQLLRHIRQKRGRAMPAGDFDYRAFRNGQLDRLSRLIEDHVNLETINPLVL